MSNLPEEPLTIPRLQKIMSVLNPANREYTVEVEGMPPFDVFTFFLEGELGYIAIAVGVGVIAGKGIPPDEDEMSAKIAELAKRRKLH